MDLVAELASLVKALEEARIDYAFCGAVALAVHGAPRATQDIDLMARRGDLDAVRRVARGCGFIFEALPMTFSSSGVTVVRFTKLIEQQPLMLDVLIADGPLEAVWKGKETVAWREGPIRVVSREGLITLKLAAGRPQGLVDVQRLREVERG